MNLSPAVILPELQPPLPATRRRLLDLFPPPPGTAEKGPAPPIGGAEPGADLPIGLATPPKIAPRGFVRPPEYAALDEAKPAADPITYETFYGMSEKPFSLSTDPKFLYHSTAHDHSGQELLSAIGRREGLFVLTGEVGVGKTLLCRAVTEELDRRTLTSVVVDPFVSLEQIIQTVLVDFGVVSRDDVSRGRLAHASSGELIAKLREFISSLGQLQAFAVVIIDEAQTLPIPILQQIREIMDSNGQQRLLQVVLVGQPSLLGLLERSELKPLRQMVGVRSELRPLVAHEVVDYVMHRLAMAGPQGRVKLDDAAFVKLYQLTGGVPRLINLVCDRALTLGHKTSASVIDEALIVTSANDLEIVAPEPRRRRVIRGVLSTLALLALAALGAAAAAWVFREPLLRALAAWGQ